MNGRRLFPRNWGFALAIVWLAGLIATALLAGVLPFRDPLKQFDVSFAGPSLSHPLGTDRLGRDLLSRAVYGARLSLTIGVSAALIGCVIGSLWGLVAGFVGGRIGAVLMAVVDFLLSFPALVFALALTAFLGPSAFTVTFVIGVVTVPAFARLTRSKVLSLVGREHVSAAVALGRSRFQVALFEIAPLLLPLVFAYTLIVVAVAIMVEGSLSFLGAGVKPPQPTWGGMIRDSKSYLGTAIHLLLVPACAMTLTVLSLNVVGTYIQSVTERDER
ncbi:MAG TPA: ABC transporter permease [Ilumatobacteraceae bacterium]|nr:ABC transporter permease [Ilumatobacteraceae bacterium]HRB03054.1 ABC transporter permease [Ilumatobacteraceae bacterium]